MLKQEKFLAIKNILLDDFTSETLKHDWTFLRNPDLTRFTAGKGYLQINGGSQTLNDFQPDFIGVRQSEFCIKAKTIIAAEFDCESAKAGMSVYYSKENHYDLYIEKKGNTRYVVLSRKIMGLEAVVSRVPIGEDKQVALSVCADEKEYCFYVKLEQGGVYVGFGTTAGVSTEATTTMRCLQACFWVCLPMTPLLDFLRFRLNFIIWK